MNITEINGFVIDKFNQYDLETGKAQGVCPLCSANRESVKGKLKCASYDWDRGIGTCHNCNNTFQLHTFQRKGKADKAYVKPPVTDRAEVFELSEAVINWFVTRGISKETLNKMQITEGKEFMPQTSKNENTIQFNYFIGGELVNVKYRDGLKHFKLYKGAEKVFYNIDNIVGHDWCVIVEGEMDALSFVEAGIENVISVPNGATLTNNNLDYLDSCIDYFEDKKKIIVAVDNDEAGKALQAELIRRLGAEICWIAGFDGFKDANEYILANGPSALKNVITNAKPCPLENVVMLRDIENEIEDFVHNGFKPGFQVGLDNFDSIFSTYTGQFITVTGIPSSGKSDFVDQMVVGYNAKYGWKTAFASPENHPIYLHSHKLIRKVWEDMPSKEDIGTEKWKNVTDHINDNFFFIDMDRYSLESVLRKGAELVKRKGIKCLVIDPFNKVKLLEAQSMSIPDYTMEYLTKIEMFAKKYNVLVIVVAHPTKMYKNQNGEIEEPTMYNIKGGGEWYDASYHGLLVHRNYTENTVKVKVLKCKFQNLGTNGAECHFKWDPRSGCFIPITPIEHDDSKLPWEV
jgi:twinkle protein